jgi:hypothetical protein
LNRDGEIGISTSLPWRGRILAPEELILHTGASCEIEKEFLASMRHILLVLLTDKHLQDAEGGFEPSRGTVAHIPMGTRPTADLLIRVVDSEVAEAQPVVRRFQVVN